MKPLETLLRQIMERNQRGLRRILGARRHAESAQIAQLPHRSALPRGSLAPDAVGRPTSEGFES